MKQTTHNDAVLFVINYRILPSWRFECGELYFPSASCTLPPPHLSHQTDNNKLYLKSKRCQKKNSSGQPVQAIGKLLAHRIIYYYAKEIRNAEGEMNDVLECKMYDKSNENVNTLTHTHRHLLSKHHKHLITTCNKNK